MRHARNLDRDRDRDSDCDPDFDPAHRIDLAQGVNCHLDLGLRPVPAASPTYPLLRIDINAP